MDKKIKAFLSSPAFAVAGASSNRLKFGNKILRCYLQNDLKVYPINLREETIENLPCVHQIADLPAEVNSLSIVTPPPITEKIVEQAILKGIQNIWMQPGAESELAILNCKMHKVNLISEGPCLLRVLGFDERD